MFERFTNAARHVVVRSQEEARGLNHNYIGTEHLLLGLLGEPEGIAAQVLKSFGITHGDVVRAVDAKVGRGKAAPSGHIPFTPRAKKTLELSLREALALGHHYIGTEHILLGLLREGSGLAAQILRDQADLLELRVAVLDSAPPGTSAPAEESGNAMLRWIRRRRGGAEAAGPDAPGPEAAGAAPEAGAGSEVTPAGLAALGRAAALAGTTPIGSHHLLLAALADANSAAARTLSSLGLDLDQLKEQLRGADVTGTTDEQPQEAGRRQMSIQVAGETLTLVLTDPVIVAAGQAALAAVNASSGRPGPAEAEQAAGEPGSGRGSATAGAEATAEGSGTEGKAGGTGGAGGEAGGTASATATVIRGDHPAAAGLADVWLELHKALEQIAQRASRRTRTARPLRPGETPGTGEGETTAAAG